jgi:hypothetical protein
MYSRNLIGRVKPTSREPQRARSATWGPRTTLSAALAIGVLVAACGSAVTVSQTAPTGPATSQAVGQTAGSTQATVEPTPTPTFDLRPVPGNSIAAPLPSDAPAVVRGLAPLPSCGGLVLFEPDPDISPLPTPPSPTSAPAANLQGANCLLSDWENDRPGQLAVSAISDEQDEIYTLYRLPGDGTVDVLTRVKSHPDQVVAWTDATCRQLSLQGDDLVPADCSQETPLN